MSKPPRSNPSDDQRIAKLLARAGVASRREVERMIADGRVALNGTVLDTPATILPSLRGVTVDGTPVEAAAPARLFVYHKPTGLLVTERDPKGRPTIYDRLPRDLPRVVPVGRLDLNTEGLLLLTTDGGFKRELELPATGVERTYRARAYGNISQAQLEELIHGIEIDGVRYGQIDANLERRTGANVWIEMTLTEGKNREVRRVLEFLGLTVSRLIRTRYGPFVLGDLPPSAVGEVRQHDLVAFRQGLRRSGRTEARIAVTPPAPIPARAPAKAPVRPQSPPSRSRVPAPRPAMMTRQPIARGEDLPLEGPVRAAGYRGSGAPAGRAVRAAPAPERSERRPRLTQSGGPAPAGPPGRSRPAAPAPAVAKPARAARAAKHRATQEPRPGELVDRPRRAGPAGGRGAPRPTAPGDRPKRGKPPRPPRTRS